MKKSSCRGFPDHRRREDRVAPVQQGATAEDRIVVLERVVPVVIAERAFRCALVRGHLADQHELGVGGDRKRTGGVVRHRELAAQHQRGQQKLGHVLRQRRDRGQDERGRPAENDVHRQRLGARLRHGVVEAASLADLPVHAGPGRVMDLDAVHAEIAAARLRMLGVDEGEREERTAVAGPGGEGGKPVQVGGRLDRLEHRPRASAPQAHLGERAEGAALAPEFRPRGRHEPLRHRRDRAHQVTGARPERHLDPLRGAEQIGHDGIGRIADPGEEEGGPPGGDHTPMHLGDLEARIHRRRDFDQLPLGAQRIEKGPQITRRLAQCAPPCLRSTFSALPARNHSICSRL